MLQHAKFSFMQRFFATILFIAFFTLSSLAGEGMWIPLLLKALNEAEMKSMGMKMTAEDIYSVNKGSLKDAVVHFGGFCTGEIISDKGLLLTNHHCGYDAIQSHSTLEKNFLIEGYWAKNLSEELPTPGLFATFIVRIEDVTASVLNGVTPEMDTKTRQSAIDKNIQSVNQSCSKEESQDSYIRPFFEGNQYFLFVTETYNDVRYVGSPPESIGKFGADTDNWVWPRHTGDFSVFRVYAGPDNKPADYSPDNKPFKPRHFFPISLDGVEEGDFTLVFGFPGRTSQYLPSFAVAQMADIIDPARIGVRDISLGIMDKHMRQNPDARLAYAAKYAGLANSWKKWIGEVQGLKSKGAVAVKENQEADFLNVLQKDKALQETYGHLLPELKSLYKELDPFMKNRVLMSEIINGSNIEMFYVASMANRLVKAYKENGEDGFNKVASQILDLTGDFYKEYRPGIDKEVFAALMKHATMALDLEYRPDFLNNPAASKSENYYESISNTIYNSTFLVKHQDFEAAIKKGPVEFTKLVEADQGYLLYQDMRKIMDEKLSPTFNTLMEKIQILQRDYVTALMKAYPNKRFWPDANNTMRVTYGQVEPYQPKDGVQYKTTTYLDGVMEKYKPGDYEFDVHPKLIELYKKKDYGQYAEDGKMPVCFIASNHTTGGNSGSPAIDARGNLIGINFDRVWEGTMSDLFYDRSICRNIMVDIRYVLFVIDKFAGAGHLLNEMKIVHPKSK